MKYTYLLTATLPSSPAPYWTTWSHPIKNFDAFCTTSYVLNSVVTEPNFYKMYSDDYQLLLWNQNCNLLICFGTPACQMGDNHQVSVELQHNFHFLLMFNSKTTGSIFTIFLHDVEQLVELLMCVSARQWCILFRNTRAKSEDGQFWHLQKSS